MKNIFIAYNHKDKIIARLVYHALSYNEWTNIEVFMDEFSILAHEDIKTRILEKARKTDLGIIILSEYTLKSEYVPQEIGILLSLDIPKIYVALHEDWRIPPGYENSIKSFPFFEWKNPTHGINELILIVKNILNPLEREIGAKELVNKAAKMSNLGDFKQALFYSEKAVQSDPQHDNAHINKINNLRKLGQYEDAIKAADEALSYLPNHPNILGVKGFVFYSIKEYENAINLLEKAVKIADRQDQRMLFYLACSYNELNNYHSARRIYEECIKLNPTSVWGRKSVIQKNYLKE